MKSDPATLDPATPLFQNAQWIWPDSHHWDNVNSYALFRKSFRLGKIPAKAPLFITADQSYRLFVNGQFVCRGPARGFQSHWPYDEIDIRPHLRAGRNLIALRAYNPGHSTFQYLTQGFAGLLVAAQWGNVEVLSDASWKCIRQAGIMRDTVPVSVQLFKQEHIDLRLDPAGWTEMNFDDSSWKAPVARRWDSPPWYSLEPRGIPMLEERIVAPLKLIGIGKGKNAKGYERVRDVVALRCEEDRSHRAPASSREAVFAPLRIAATGKGRFRSFLFDFGHTVVGNLTFDITGAKGGEIIDTHFAETINAETLIPDQIYPTHCRVAFGSRLICRAGNAPHHFYHHYGFRYLAITVRDAVADFELVPQVRWTGYPLPHKGSFRSSDRDIEQIWQACAWTQQCCSLDAYVDTPWREQAQWWGDARVQAWNTFYLNGDPRLFRRGISQIASQTTPDGVTYGHAPTMAHECILPDFTLIWFLTLWDYYWQTGSTEPLTTHHETIQKALAYFKEHTDPGNGLVGHDPRYWLFLDWTDIFRDGFPAVYNLWLLIALEKLAALYRKARRPRDATPLEALAGKLRRALEPLVDTDGLVHDGIDREGSIVPETSIHSQVLGLNAKLKGINPKNALEKILLPYIRGEISSKATPSSYWVTYVFSALAEHGHGAEVIAFIKKFWLPMAQYGTVWEQFHPDLGNETHSHAWSAHPLFHFMNIVGGITQTSPQWSTVTFQPSFHGDHCRTEIPSPKGQIISKWERRKDKIDMELKLPPASKPGSFFQAGNRSLFQTGPAFTHPAK